MMKSLTHFWLFSHVALPFNIQCHLLRWHDHICLMNRDTKRGLICLKDENQKRKRKGSENSHYQWICDVQRHAHISKGRQLFIVCLQCHVTFLAISHVSYC